MNSQLPKFYELAELETFDPGAFQADNEVSQEVCNLVLTLAVIFNDLKDLLYAHIILDSEKPTGQFQPDRHWGSYLGMYNHIFRLLLGLAREIIALLQKEKKATEDHYFKSVIRQLTKEERDAWQALIDASQDTHLKDPVEKFLFFIRTKITFHYDPKEICSGYRNQCILPNRKFERVYISRGCDTADTRFFFADAAVDGYFRRIFPGDDNIKEAIAILKHINLTIRSIVHHFIQKRGYAYRKAGKSS